ncbi:hypothetical protein [Erythrobacter ani]|uniref:Uncharacterized protein n=1 Tax=Erythrobacter ani TaxID=2827235 RepID=A0ABS6SMI6_9SPHN|nr:hypothetical protein [Erythrobacter ani]MBV7266204.1 hypothetical protein [Erythrobacter ani]
MSEDMLFWIGLAVLGIVFVAVVKRKAANSSSLIVTGPGVLKTLNIECLFWSEDSGRKIYHGKLSQDRWSDGQERFSLRLHNLPSNRGSVQLLRGDQRVSEFETQGSSVRFAWKGMISEEIPAFSIGENLAILVGDQKLTGTVEPD